MFESKKNLKLNKVVTFESKLNQENLDRDVFDIQKVNYIMNLMYITNELARFTSVNILHFFDQHFNRL